MNVQFSSKPYLPALIVSVVLFISILLPWFSISIGIFGSASENGFGDWGILTFLMSIFGIALAFLTVERARAIGLVIGGVLALLGVLLYWLHMEWSFIAYGSIIALIASVAMAIMGYLDLRKAQNTTPTAPPTPPASPTQ